jgi:hypothetical protein
VSLGVSCLEIATAETPRDRSSVIVGVAAAQVATLGLTLIIGATPIGWVGIVGVALIGAGVGSISDKLYDKYGSDIDLAEISGVSKVCNAQNLDTLSSKTKAASDGAKTALFGTR